MSVGAFLRGAPPRPNPAPDAADPPAWPVQRWQVSRRGADAGPGAPWEPLFGVEAARGLAWNELVGEEGRFAPGDLVRLDARDPAARDHAFVREAAPGGLVPLPSLDAVLRRLPGAGFTARQWARWWGSDWAGAWDGAERPEWLVTAARAAGVPHPRLVAAAAAILHRGSWWLRGQDARDHLRAGLDAAQAWAASQDPTGPAARAALDAARGAFREDARAARVRAGEPVAGQGVLAAAGSLLDEALHPRPDGDDIEEALASLSDIARDEVSDGRAAGEAETTERRTQLAILRRDHLPLGAVLYALTDPPA